jgi:hypothetical protein
MAKGSDNPFPSVLFDEGSTPSSPAAGHQRLFIDSADNRVKRVNSSGTVAIIESTQTFARKSSDESVTSSATLQDDDALVAAMGTSQTWLIQLNLVVTSAADNTGNIKVAFTVPAGATVHGWGAQGRINFGAATQDGDVRNFAEVTGSVTATGFVACTDPTNLTMWALVSTAGTAGNWQLQWAQNASSGNATTVESGSWLLATRAA